MALPKPTRNRLCWPLDFAVARCGVRSVATARDARLWFGWCKTGELCGGTGAVRRDDCVDLVLGWLALTSLAPSGTSEGRYFGRDSGVSTTIRKRELGFGFTTPGLASQSTVPVTRFHPPPATR